MDRDLETAVPEGQGSVTVGGSARSLRRELTLILALLLMLAAASWAILIWQSRTANGMGIGLTMGMGAALFVAIWVVMMIAMMFPTAAPMILVFARVQRDRHSGGRAFVPMWVFIGTYLLIWALFGVVAYLGAFAASGLAQQLPWIMMNAARIGGGILVLAGLYQLTPLKRVCLAKCRTPQDFILTSWRDGSPGAFRMGLEHGTYCLGCNWLLFVLLFPVGVMNIAAMALLTALIFAEKFLPLGVRIAQFAALVLILYGALVIVMPVALPLSGAGM
jgi:predicted metal-binding membrane protein